jgi:hypothetical protein
MRDFTLKVYEKLINSILNNGYSFQTLEDFLKKPIEKVVILRHDCDIWPGNDLKVAQIENKYNIKATYYFRIPKTFNQNIINSIILLGHEIGYHYEDLAEQHGDCEKAIKSFSRNLHQLRQLYPVKTIAMHGRPFSKWDSRDLWKKYRLEDFGLLGEPYLSVNYNDVLYLTDTGSRWNGDSFSIRDSVDNKFIHQIRTTFQLIDSFNKDKLPTKVLINVHAARWNDNYLIWIYRYFLQLGKNAIKRYYKQLLLR